jgi:hypothetical protein
MPKDARDAAMTENTSHGTYKKATTMSDRMMRGVTASNVKTYWKLQPQVHVHSPYEIKFCQCLVLEPLEREPSNLRDT